MTFDEEQIFKNLSSSTKRNIKKAIRNKVSIDISNSYSALEEFYIMNCITRKRHGLPPQPPRFFRNIYDFVLHENNGFVSIARYNEKSIAGAIYLSVKKKLFINMVLHSLNINFPILKLLRLIIADNSCFLA